MGKSKEKDEIIMFLNTWELPNDSRIPREHLTTQEDLKTYFAQENTDNLTDVILFRNDLRKVVSNSSLKVINQWIIKRNINIQMMVDNGRYRLDFHTNQNSIIDHILILILRKVEEGNFHRYKICPDCKWAFYDRSKSSTKKWCSMKKNSSSGRACGTIAKVKKYREKNKKSK
ncbi:CGNR zinc finger domain-containing protein [Cytobacillus oceanisediminis]|uniref:CGNR zinc finger domain-containing protein n=1 Tax=Cytobacillus oceanisediminis TaxID=665099 RepID=UPI001FB53BA5|nr:CGNR zinc finger domain-containing protein [Cytobacillus oceanisediminis]UOE53481.1 CGNR zinc finger domain-containing protein [Cytobacillus oceanisediminis]